LFDQGKRWIQRLGLRRDRLQAALQELRRLAPYMQLSISAYPGYRQEKFTPGVDEVLTLVAQLMLRDGLRVRKDCLRICGPARESRTYWTRVATQDDAREMAEGKNRV
jgi:hypothetical protein